MARRRIHYEQAFEDFLRSHYIPYIAVDEAKRALLPTLDVKNADFIVHAPSGSNFIVDVKGKRFPYEHRGRRTYWESWIHAEDLQGLAVWRSLMGERFDSLLVFAYWIRNLADRRVDGLLFSTLHRFHDRDYAFVAVRLDDFARLFRERSKSWNAVDMARRSFESVLVPFGALVGRPEELQLAGKVLT
ncbi:MAG: HYExAFE family protein [Planctomycetota bacterium]